MSTPSSRLVLVTTARTSPAFSPDSILAAPASSVDGAAMPISPRRLRRSASARSQVVRDLLGEGPGVGEDDRVRWPSMIASEAAEQPAIGQPAVRRLVGPDQRLDGELRRRRAVGRGGFDDAAGPRDPDEKPRDRCVGAAGRREARRGTDRGRALARAAPARRPGRPPRFVGARAWTSSTITCSTPRQCVSPGSWLSSKREALGRGDQHVRRVVAQLPTIVGRGVAGTHAHPHRAGFRSRAGGDALQRRGEVPLDVVVEAPQRRDIHAAQAGPSIPASCSRKSRSSTPGTPPVSCRSRSGDQQHVLAGRDRRPRQRLAGRRPLRETPPRTSAHRPGQRRDRIPNALRAVGSIWLHAMPRGVLTSPSSLVSDPIDSTTVHAEIPPRKVDDRPHVDAAVSSTSSPRLHDRARRPRVSPRPSGRPDDLFPGDLARVAEPFDEGIGSHRVSTVGPLADGEDPVAAVGSGIPDDRDDSVEDHLADVGGGGSGRSISRVASHRRQSSSSSAWPRPKW